jgi:hypothetical protein
MRQDFQTIRKMSEWVGLDTWTPREKEQFNQALSNLEDEVAQLMNSIDVLRAALEQVLERPWNAEVQTVHGLVAQALLGAE